MCEQRNDDAKSGVRQWQTILYLPNTSTQAYFNTPTCPIK